MRGDLAPDLREGGASATAFYGVRQISSLLGLPRERLELPAAGINHFTWFQACAIANGRGPLSASARVEHSANWVSDWHEIGLSRILFRRFGLWPSPSANHLGEYISWADDYVPAQLQYFHDPADGSPWPRGRRYLSGTITSVSSTRSAATTTRGR